METVTLYSTWPSAEDAETAARAALDARLIACANIVPGVLSIYRWESEVRKETEAVMFAKTTAERATDARDLLLKLHPYDLPCVTVLPIRPGESHASFLLWVAGETAPVT